MNRLEVQEIYDRLKEPKSVDYIELLGFKSCVFNDFFWYRLSREYKRYGRLY